jgi:SAM-dependent methyltransferase
LGKEQKYMGEDDKIRENVRKAYRAIAVSDTAGCGCTPSCCSPQPISVKDLSTKLGYSTQEIEAAPDGSNMGLGCGNPQAIANLKRGEIVLDLGAGGGFDCFLAAKQVGDEGKVIGVDMTPEMVSKARENAKKTGVHNVEFRLGEIEYLPVSDSSVDVIISNCVINLSPDKRQVFAEAYRVLRPNGRLAISDIIALREMPEDLKNDIAKYTGCVSGAATQESMSAMLVETGFSDIRIELNEESRKLIKEWFPGSGIEDYVSSASIEAKKTNERLLS